MVEPRVRPQRANPFDKLKDDLVNKSKIEANKASRNVGMDMRSRMAQNDARHTANEYAPIKETWSQGVIDSEIYLDQEMVGDDEVREKIGLPPNVSLDMLRADPNLWKMFPVAEQRLRQHENELMSGASAEAQENTGWFKQGLGFIKDGLLDAGIKVGEAYELLWKPADMLNEKLEQWFPEDATGTRKYMGHVLGAAMLPMGLAGSQEGFQPRMPTPKQIQGTIQDSLADLGVGDDEQNQRYRERIQELKDEGMSDDEARIQAFEERTDMPGWFKFTLPMMSDPLTYVGLPALAKTIGKGAIRAGTGIVQGAKSPITGKNISSIGKLPPKQQKAQFPEAPEIDDIVEHASQGGSKFTAPFRRVIKAIDPSGELKHLPDGSAKKVLLGAMIGGKHIQEFAERAGGFMKSQAQGNFGKLDDVWGKSVLDDDQGVMLQKLGEREWNPLQVGESETFADGLHIKKIDEYGSSKRDDILDDFGDQPTPEQMQQMLDDTDFGYSDDFAGMTETDHTWHESGRWGDTPAKDGVAYEITDDSGNIWDLFVERDVYLRRDKLGRFAAGAKGRKGGKVDLRRRPEVSTKGGSETLEDLDILYERPALDIRPDFLQNAAEIVARDFPDIDYLHGIRATVGHAEGITDAWPVSRLAQRRGLVPVGEKMRVPLSDVIENHKQWALSPDQKNFAIYFNDVFAEFRRVAKKEGINLKEWGTMGEAIHYMARATKGFKDENGVQLLKEIERSPASGPRPGAADFMKKRAFDEMQDGLNEGWLYENVYDVLEIYGRSFYRQVATNRMEKYLEPITRGKTAEDLFPTYTAQNKRVQAMMDGQAGFMKELDNFISHGGTKFDTRVVKSMKDAFMPLVDDTAELKAAKLAIIDDIDKVLAPEFDLWQKAIRNMKIEGFALPGVNTARFLQVLKEHRAGMGLAQPRHNIGVGEIRQAIKKLNVSKADERKIMDEVMRKAGDEIRQTRKGQLAELREKMNQVLPDSQKVWKKIQDENDLRAELAMNPNVRTEAASAMFPNLIFTNQPGNSAKAAALAMDKAFLDDGGQWIKHMANANAAIRFAKTTADLGAPLIQGLPILFTDSAAWGKAVGMQFKAFGNSAVRARYTADNAEEIAEFLKYGMHVGSSEMTEALSQGGWLAALPRLGEVGMSRIGLAEDPAMTTSRKIAREVMTGAPRAIGNVTRRFQTSFDTFLDVARIEVMKGLKPVAMASDNPHKAMADIAQFSNKLTGIVSTKAMGVSATQRGIESSILMFSPRYTRAIAALFIDMTRGGLRGDMARKSIASLFAGQIALHAAAAAALDQEMNLIPGNAQFLKLKIGDDWVGFGGKANSLMNMAADVTLRTQADPEAFMDFKSWSSETLGTVFKRARYQMSPLGGQAMNFITDETAIGEKMPDPADLFSNPAAFAKYSGTVVAPFWAEAALEANGTGAFGEFMGAGVTPISPKLRLDELREKLIREKYGEQYPGITWDKFKKMPTYRSKYALMLEEYPELKVAEDFYEEQSRRFKWAESQHKYQDSLSQIRRDMIHGTSNEQGQLVEQGYDQVATEFLSGVNGRRSGEVFRQKMTTINEVAQGRRRDERAKYPDMMADREEYYQGAAKENLVAAARNELFDFLASPRAKDAFGNVNHEAIENFKKELEGRYEKYGEGMGKTVADELKFANDQQLMETPEGSAMPKIVQEYYKSWDVLKPFWRIYEEVLPEESWDEWQLFAGSPEQQKNTLRLNPKYKSMERIVENRRRIMRRQNYEIDKFLTMFFDYAPENPKRAAEIRRQASRIRSGRPLTNA